MTRTAAALVIGNEILTGKVRDENVEPLALELFAMGVAFRRVVMCVDAVDVIAEEVNALRAAHDVVFTSGGVGPTHDDVTIEAVAQAFGVAVVRSAEIGRRIQERYSSEITESHWRMALIPEGAELISTEPMRWPLMKKENVFILPGVPSIFRSKLPFLRAALGPSEPFATRFLYLEGDEAQFAEALREAADAHPEVAIGSYLCCDAEVPTVKITFDGRNEAAVNRAFEAVERRLNPTGH